LQDLDVGTSGLIRRNSPTRFTLLVGTAFGVIDA